MREIIYIQAGRTANFINTHFWNTQESYFTYDDLSQTEEAREPIVNHDISFREGLSTKASQSYAYDGMGSQTYCPRALIFDYRDNFGNLSRYNELYEAAPETERDVALLWDGSTLEQRQEPILKSGYQKRLEEEGAEEEVPDNQVPSNSHAGNDSSTTRSTFWPDFNRLFYVPRSIQKLPNPCEWKQSVDFGSGRESFGRHNADYDLMDEDFRSFVEECDNFQGFQFTFDVPTFGGFSVALLETLRDEYAKSAILSFPILSGMDPTASDAHEPLSRNNIFQDALCLRSLNELSSVSVPLRMPTTWKRGSWMNRMNIDLNSLYHTSAVLATHIESATLPLRLQNSQVDLYDLCAHLNIRQITRFSHLSGALPLVEGEDTSVRLFDYTASETVRKASMTTFAQRNVTRGCNLQQAMAMEGFLMSTTDLDDPYLSTVHAPAYPLPSSFPPLFDHSLLTTSSNSKTTARSTIKTDLPTIRVLSSLTTTQQTSKIFSSLAKFLDASIKTRRGGGDGEGMTRDEMKTLGNDLWTLCDDYGTGEDGFGEAEASADEGIDTD